MKSVTLDRKLSSTARLPQRSTIVESPAGRIADANGLVTSARSTEAITAQQYPSEVLTEADPDETSQSANLDVIRPAFARNNTSVLIVNDVGSDLPDDTTDRIGAISFGAEDDAITLGDIPLLAGQAIRQAQEQGQDERPLLSSLNPLQSLIIKHFALLQLEKSGIGHLIELDEVLELLESRKGQWWNKIFKGNDKKDKKKKGMLAYEDVADIKASLVCPLRFWSSGRVPTRNKERLMRNCGYLSLSRISSPPCGRWVGPAEALIVLLELTYQIWRLRVSSGRTGISDGCSRYPKRSIRIPRLSICQRRTLFSWLLCSNGFCGRCRIRCLLSGSTSCSALLPVSWRYTSTVTTTNLCSATYCRGAESYPPSSGYFASAV